MRLEQLAVSMAIGLAASGAGDRSWSQCLPSEPGHSQGPMEFWEWHHDLIPEPDCAGFIFLAGGESVEQPFSDATNLTTRDWHVEVKTDPPGQVVCFNIFGQIYCTSIFGGLFHLAIPEPADQEIGNWVARWSNTSTDPSVSFGIDSSVAEQGTGDIIPPPHEDIGDWVLVDTPPKDALLLELEFEGPTPTRDASWGMIKSLHR